MSNKKFYRAFEDKHRGSRELIKERMSVYLPFVLPLKELYTDGFALDIGCGRGEWLELLKENGISSRGIDTDGGMLNACHVLKLDVEKSDGIAYLQKQPNESAIIISAFHVVEHISFDALQTLVSESLRVLKPGGLLILETPNPENIKVATENFYLDPTHIRPIPSSLLSFLPEYYGFARTKVLRLQESKDLADTKDITISDLICGVSPDYAVVAQKNTIEDTMSSFDSIFSQKFGLSLPTLAEKFENRLLKLEAKANEAEAKASEAEAKASEAEKRTIDALHNYHMVVNSNSWKLMKPFRLFGNTARWFVTGVKHWITFSPTSRPRRTLKKVLVSLKHRINAYPKLKTKIIRILNRYPSIKYKLKKIEMRSNQEIPIDQAEKKPIFIRHGLKDSSISEERIYIEIKNEIKKRREHIDDK